MNPHRLLIVDDEAPMLRSLERMLGGRYELRLASDLPSALAAVEDFEPDLAVLDVRLPGEDGFGLLSQAARTLPAYGRDLHHR